MRRPYQVLFVEYVRSIAQATRDGARCEARIADTSETPPRRLRLTGRPDWSHLQLMTTS